MPTPAELKAGDLIANRYRIERLLGSGGMAAVYEATDLTRGASIALKRLLSRSTADPTRVLLFQREFATLSQLSHPLVIRAFDYGLHENEPYYTMELVSGDDLRALAPLRWREASRLLCDVASALAFIHSRRFVHRDVTARNVRRTTLGRAKLLDFGALCPMGVTREVAGTPPFVPPESLEGQPLDARSDLFSLGALAYYLLTAKHAYPASSLAELHAVWNRRIEPPSAAVPQIPQALDTLILSLLDLNPLMRPGSAAEVFDRLSALSGGTLNDAPEVAQAYLVTPTLVGREDVLVRFRRRMLRAERRRGSSLLIEGDAGSGRSRLLTDLTTEARLRGIVIAYAKGDEGQRGPFGVARALVGRLAESEPVLCRAALGGEEVLRSLSIGQSELAAPTSSESDSALVSVLTRWFLSVASRMTLAIAIDDVENSDEPSLSVLARLAEAAPSCRLLVILTCERGSSKAAVAHFKRVGGSRVIQPFRASETRELLGSVFGDVPHLDGVARWVHRLAEGNARTALDLAQHLVAQRVARYEQGSWVLPDSLDGLNLPESLEQAFDAKVAGLSERARRLAQSLALTPEHDPLLLEEYTKLIPEVEMAELLSLLDELSAASILVQHGTSHVFANRTIRQGVRRAIPEDRLPLLHAELAHAYSSGGSPNFLTAYHWYMAGRPREAFAAFVQAMRTDAVRGRSLMRSPEGVRLCEALFEWGHAESAPPTDLAIVGRAVLQRASIADTNLARHAPLIMARLEQDSGLVYWDELEHVADPAERVRLCVHKAYEAREKAPESQRGLDPVSAIQELTLSSAILSGVYARAHDPEPVSRLVTLVDRLRPLSPAVGVVGNLLSCAAQGLRGWATGELRLHLIEQVAEPIPGFDETSRKAIHLLTVYYQALDEALVGAPVVFERSALLEQDASYEPLAWQVRMIAHLFQGAAREAERCRRKRDLTLTGRSDVDQHLETSLAFESAAYVILGDLMALKRMLPVLRERAAQWPNWKPLCLLAEGAYSGIRGHGDKALALSQQALNLVQPGAHAVWALAMTRVVRLLVQAGRAEQARSLAAEALVQAARYPLVSAQIYHLEMALALAESLLSDAPAAAERAARVIARAEQRGVSGILLIELYALQAQIAQNTNDAPTLERTSIHIAKLCSKVDSPAFAAKLSSLLKLSLGGGFEPMAASPGILVRKRLVPSALGAKIRTELELCRGPEERAKRTLGLVLEQSRIKQGFLYLNHRQGPTLAASRADYPPPVETEEHVLRCLRKPEHEDEEATQTTSTAFGERFSLVSICTRREEGLFISAVAVLDCAGARPKPIPDSILDTLAQALVEAGDAIPN